MNENRHEKVCQDVPYMFRSLGKAATGYFGRARDAIMGAVTGLILRETVPYDKPNTQGLPEDLKVRGKFRADLESADLISIYPPAIKTIRPGLARIDNAFVTDAETVGNVAEVELGGES